MEDRRWRIEDRRPSIFNPVSSIFHPLSSILYLPSSIFDQFISRISCVPLLQPIETRYKRF